MLRKLITSLVVMLLIFLNAITTVNANSVSIEPEDGKNNEYDVTSNYYGKVEDKTQIAYPNESVLSGYQKIASDTNGNELYLQKTKFNIAIKLANGYIFYSAPQYYGFRIWANKESGDEIATNTMLIDGKYSFTLTKGSKTEQINESAKITYEDIDNGVKATLNFKSLGIIINVYLTLENGKIKVYIPTSEIEENGYDYEITQKVTDENGKEILNELGLPMIEKVPAHMNFYLSSLELFPFFGASGYAYTYNASGEIVSKKFENIINGYNFIPDGSGALVRYQYDRIYSTMYSKKVFGNDYGIKEDSALTSHLASNKVLSVPVFGVNHGYNQNAFLCNITEGEGAAELYLEPFGYNNVNVQTSYFRFYTREQYIVKMATSESGLTSILPSKMYQNDIAFEYNFLEGNSANYSGMAKCYRDEYLELGGLTEKENISLGLNVLAQDYKKGLIFKKFVAMTKYSDLLNIVKDLEAGGVKDFSISYLGYNKNGYYNNSSYKPRTTLNLGTSRTYKKLMNYLADKEYDLEACVDILTSYNKMEKDIVKKYNLETFTKGSDSKLFTETYLMNIKNSSKKITKYNKNYKKLGISNINLEGYSTMQYSYRYKNTNYSRSQIIDIAEQELAKIAEKYNISLVKANSYTFNYVSKIYESETSSSLYTYMTDSVPFISLALSGYIELYSDEINFIPDYDQYCLRLIEYNIYPYFTITKNDSSKLRYTNSEGLFTSQYSLWNEKIKAFYNYTNDALGCVAGASMISHEYVLSGVAKVTYSNGKIIYVNHNTTPVSVDGINLEALGYEVK